MSGSIVWFITAFLAFLPISELRGAIPFAMAHQIPWYIAFPFAALLNAMVAPVCWIFLSTLNRLFLKMEWYKKFFDRFIESARAKLHEKVEKWGWLGITIFVAIPLPITGAWTGTLGAWVLGISKRRTLLAVILGVVIAGAIVTSVMLLGLQGLKIFVKQVEAP
ncbi:COG2426 family protein [Leadbettera azotonutricia]|uniref:Small multidrug export protein n=1 Tax=Leadbettera azotonutricia (strain ATCC BAA-888 / DSM 13862 / ZAS-9) TaxID=545695 RepID=F5YC17_LEAAZ|nr:small multi-drug export protein [Leadbettera azotonutricia]AEF83212.1 small multidrug export protein [Leadbettera azotonutricia ZAS-9]